MSIQQNFPAISPSLSLNFARSKTLDPRITFTRTSSATRINETGLVEVVPANAPRFDHSYDPVSGSVRSLGLLVEEQRSNLITYSEDFRDFDTSITWENFGVNIEPNSIISPDGKLNGTKLINTSGTASRRVSSPLLTVTSGVTHTHSVWLKAGEYTTATVFCNTTAVNPNFNNLSARINLVTGVVSGTINTPITVISYPNGWWRISSTFTTDENTATTGLLSIVPNTDAGGVNSVVGDGTSGIYIWGAQLEAGAFPTSYIPTTNSTVTRTADNVSMVGENFSSWYNQSESTFFTSFRPAYNASATVPARTPHVLQAGNATTVNDNYTIRGAESNPYWTVLIRSASPSSLQFPGFNPYPYLNSSTQYKAALSVNTSLISVSLNGLLNADSANTTTVNHTTPFNKLFIGSGTGGGPPYELTGHIAQLTYYPRRLTNDNLQNLTK